MDNDCPVVVWDIRKLLQQLDRLENILGWEGVYAHNLGQFYMVFVQATLLFGFGAWEMTPRMVKTLGGSTTAWPGASRGRSHNTARRGCGIPPTG